METLTIQNCYLCGKKLEGSISFDHIIPDTLFRKNDPDRPKLPVHIKCNNQKSVDDEWFVKQLQLRSSFHPDAMAEFSKMLKKAISETPKAYLIGERVHHLKLAKGIFSKVNWGMEIVH